MIEAPTEFQGPEYKVGLPYHKQQEFRFFRSMAIPDCEKVKQP